MKLLECYIENFGKLSHFSYRFRDGMNIFCRENGWGKSTFAGFIKAMLYGLTPSRATDAQQNERLRYLPWQGGKCGGTLTFSVGEETYRVERYFGTKESEDTFALYDCKTGMPSTAYSAKLGEELFDIDAQGYERSTYISEKLTADPKADYTGIQAKLVDMNDLSDYVIAKKKLDKRRMYYHVQGGRGAIADVANELSLRRTELEDAQEALKKTNELNRRARELDSRRDELENSLREVRRRLDSSVSLRESRALEAHKADLEQNLARTREATSACRAYLSGNLPPAEVLEEQSRNWRTLSETKKPENTVRVPSPVIAPCLFAAGAAGLIAGVITGLKFHPLLLLLSVVGLLLMGCGVCFTFLRRRAGETLRATRAAQAEYDRLSASLAAFLRGYPIVMADPALKDDGDRLWAIRNKMNELANARRAEEEASNACLAFRSGHPELFDSTPREASEELKAGNAEQEALLREIDSVREARAGCEREIARYAAAAGRYTACAQEIANLEEKKREREKSLEIIQLTQQYLATARNALTSRYLTDIQLHFRSYMRLLTEVDRESAFSDEYESEAYTVTPDFCVNITKFGKTRPATTLSRGGRDLVALCLRFAISDALFHGKNPPLILDDPFINLDDEKTKAAMALLHKVAETRQIFYVSCHSSRA